MKRFVILHNIRSAHNVGSIFRTADGAGVSKIFLVGYTPSVIDRFGREQPEIKKTSLGATESIPWEHHESLDTVLEELAREGIVLIAVEQHESSLPYTQYHLSSDAAFIFGNEVEGVPSEVCEQARAVIEIPMLGKKESLNVGVSAGVVLFHYASETEL